MNLFSKITGSAGNESDISPDVNMHQDCTLEFKPFYNGSGGTQNKVTIGAGGNFRLLKVSIQGAGNELIIGSGCSFSGAVNIAIIGTNRVVRIGNNCTINGLILNCRDEDVIIGDDCLLSNEIKIRSSDAHKIFDRSTKIQINKPRNAVQIGNHVWIGQGVFIGKNAIVPNGCVIGTRSVITKQLSKENCIIGGTGGKILREDIFWEK